MPPAAIPRTAVRSGRRARATDGRPAALAARFRGREARVAAEAGVRALLVHALNESARGFYEHYGFRASTLHPMTPSLRLPSPR
jgi:hypothetical protein